MNQMHLILLLLMNRISQLEAENTRLKQEDISHTAEDELSKLRKELEDAENIVKSMKEQYTELMNTAQSYKDEASKWHYLYHTRKATKVEN